MLKIKIIKKCSYCDRENPTREARSFSVDEIVSLPLALANRIVSNNDGQLISDDVDAEDGSDDVDAEDGSDDVDAEDGSDDVETKENKTIKNRKKKGKKIITISECLEGAQLYLQGYRAPR
jgi:hypothetical protein